jgi:hypothetical protein
VGVERGGAGARASRSGRAAERIGDRLARVVFVDSNAPADGESSTSAWSEERVAELTERGFWPP